MIHERTPTPIHLLAGSEARLSAGDPTLEQVDGEVVIAQERANVRFVHDQLAVRVRIGRGPLADPLQDATRAIRLTRTCECTGSEGRAV